jgi:hypothetical protein
MPDLLVWHLLLRRTYSSLQKETKWTATQIQLLELMAQRFGIKMAKFIGPMVRLLNGLMAQKCGT